MMNRDKIYVWIKNPRSDTEGCTIYTLGGESKIFAPYCASLQQDIVQKYMARMSDEQLLIFQKLILIFLDKETLKRVDADGISSLLVFLAQASIEPKRIEKLELRIGIWLPSENTSLRLFAYMNYAIKAIQQIANIWFGYYPNIVVYSAANMVLREELWWNGDIDPLLDRTRQLLWDFLTDALPTEYPTNQLYIIQDKKVIAPSTQEIIRVLGNKLFDVIQEQNPVWFQKIGNTLQRKGKEISPASLGYTAAHALYSKDIVLWSEGLFDDDSDANLVIMIGGPSETAYQFARKEVANIASEIGFPGWTHELPIKVITRVDKVAPYRDERYLINNRPSDTISAYGSAKKELETLFTLAPKAVEKILSPNLSLSWNE